MFDILLMLLLGSLGLALVVMVIYKIAMYRLHKEQERCLAFMATQDKKD